MPRAAVAAILTFFLIAGLVWLAWQLVYVLLLAFGGLLLAIFLRRAANALSRHSPLSAGAALAGVVLALAVALVLIVVLVGPQLLSQVETLWRSLPAAWAQVENLLQQRDWGRFLLDRMSDGESRPGWNLVGTITGTVSTVAGVGANLVVLLTVAIFLAVDPGLYRRGVLHLVPPGRRVRAREVLDAVGDALWRWLLGQSVDMLAVAAVTGLGLWLLGSPLPLALGLIAGLTNFIPYVGPFIAAVPAVLIAFTQSPTAALYTGLLFLVIQQAEGNVLMPLIQERATALPPVLVILAVVGFGVLFGLLGALFATPLLLVIIVLVQMLYVEDVLGDRGARSSPDEA